MKIISCSLSPNTETDDVTRAISTIVQPHLWKKGVDLSRVEEWFKKFYDTESIYFYTSGRSALYEMLKAYGITRGDEVIVQAFTCVAVPNAVIWTQAKPVYVDIDSTYTMSVIDLEKKISSKTKAIIVQHTFGIPANVRKIIQIAKQRNIIVIEDQAHSFKKIEGDAAIVSFGRDKVISSVWGGAAIFQKHNTKHVVDQHMAASYEQLQMPSYAWIAQQLMHPIAFSLIVPLYNSGIGKLLLVFLQKIHVLSLPLDDTNNNSMRYPNGLARLLLHQLEKINDYEEQRKNITMFYNKKLHKNIIEKGLLRYPIEVLDQLAVLNHTKKAGILLGNWYHNIIDPKDIRYEDIFYKKGMCPYAEQAAKKIINLPTRITIQQAYKVIEAITN